jgi:amino acid transporter
MDSARPGRGRLSLWPLVAATFFMVSGGPYGLEELLAKAGYAHALIILVVTPLVWSLPVSLMVGELGAAIPETGGYYAWVRRALGPFWGFQEAWWSLAASFFDMAIYPTLFTLYLGQLWPAVGHGWPAVAIGASLVVGCALWNLRGAHAVGGAAVLLMLILFAPFVAMVVAAFVLPSSPGPPPPENPTLLGGLLVAMWNFMGWDNASTVAAEVDRPQHTYPRGMIITVVLVTLGYVIPVLACRHMGLATAGWTTGAWADAGQAIGGHALRLAVVLGGAVCAFGMFNALVLSYSRLPLAMAQDRLLPSVFARRNSRGVPVFAVLGCAIVYVGCLGLGFDRLVLLDVILYGASLALEFVALIVLRLREPDLPRPFRVPGGIVVAVLLGVPPMVLLGFAAFEASHGGWLAPILCAALIVVGPCLYLVVRRRAV